jgi:3-oxoacyl-[acyl-carrier protein] reductase
MDLGLKDKVVIITGGGGDIGRAIALAFAREGARLAISDLDLRAAEAVAEQVGGENSAIAVRTNVTDPDSVRELFETVVARFGRVDVLVNGAGIFHGIPIDDLTVLQWDSLMAVNLKGVFLCSQAAMRVMKPRGYGKVVNIASMGGQVGGIVAGADYSASKAGVACFTKSLAKNAGPFGINVNTVNPGVIETQMTKPWGEDVLQKRRDETPLRRNGTAEDVAGVVVFLASDVAGFVHGAHVDINGGIYTD